MIYVLTTLHTHMLAIYDVRDYFIAIMVPVCLLMLFTCVYHTLLLRINLQQSPVALSKTSQSSFTKTLLT